MRGSRWTAIALTAVLLPLLPTATRAQSATVVENDGIEITNPLGQVFKIDSLVPVSMVILGESGGVDANLYVKDPNFSVDENAFVFDASTAILTLGSGRATEDGADGDLSVTDKAGTETIRLSGDDGGRATQTLKGEGFVKAWVRVAPDGTILSSYNVSAVDNAATGVYFVTLFTPAAADRPITATLDGHNVSPTVGFISVGFPDDFHPGTKQVVTRLSNGEEANLGFNLVVH